MSLKSCGEIDMDADKIGQNAQCTFKIHCMKLINLYTITGYLYNIMNIGHMMRILTY